MASLVWWYLIFTLTTRGQQKPMQLIVCMCLFLQKDQLNLQSVDIISLRESLQVEQQRYRQLWDDRETVVTRLHSQIRQLQQARDDYYTKNQELQVLINLFIFLKLRS